MEKYASEIIEFGLWQSDDEVENILQTYPTNGLKVSALKAQIRFRQHVLKQEAEREVFAFSKNKVDLTLQELKCNVLKLVNIARRIPVDESKKSFLIGKCVSHQFDTGADENDTGGWYDGTVISQVPGYPNWFNIKYDGDPAIYTYQLMEDYKNGSLRLITERNM